MNSVRSNILNLKYQRFKPSGCKDIGIRPFSFVAKTISLKNICNIFMYRVGYREVKSPVCVKNKSKIAHNFL